MSYPSVYFHHIPKTAGAFTFKSLADGGLIDELNKKGLTFYEDTFHIINLLEEDKIVNSNFINGHFAADPYYINPNTVGFTVIRNPVARIVSHFWWFFEYEKYFNKYSESDMESREKFFDIWINNDEDMHIKSNYQAKFLVNKLSKDSILQNYPIYRGEWEYKSPRVKQATTYKIGWGVDNKEVTEDQALAFLKQMPVAVCSENISKDIDIVISFINDYLHTDIKNPHIDKHNVNESTGDFIKNLKPSHIRRIEELNNVDYSLWDSVKSNRF